MLGEGPHELSTAAHSKECKRSPQQFIPAGVPPHDTLQPGTEDSVIPLTTPDMVRSGRCLSLTLNGEDPVATTTCFRQADIKSSTIP